MAGQVASDNISMDPLVGVSQSKKLSWRNDKMKGQQYQTQDNVALSIGTFFNIVIDTLKTDWSSHDPAAPP